MRVTESPSSTSDMSDVDSCDLFASGLMSDVRLMEEKTKWRNRILDMSRKLERPLNVAIIGPPGVGKSSLVNTIGAAFSDDTWREYAYSGFHGDSSQITVFTKSFPKCCHGDDKEYADAKLPTLVDIAGFTDEKSEKIVELLRIVFYGRLPVGESLGQAEKYAKEFGLDGLRKKYSANNESLKIDRVIVVSTATEIVPDNLIKCVIDAARPAGVVDSYKRTIPVFGVLTKQDKVGSDQISKEDYVRREREFMNALGLTGSEHRFLRCSNYCQDVDQGRRTSMVLPELDLPVLKFICQVADPVFEVHNQDESYTKYEEEFPLEDELEEPGSEVRRRRPADNTTVAPPQRISARTYNRDLFQGVNISRDKIFYIKVVVEMLIFLLVLQIVLRSPVDIGKLRIYCKLMGSDMKANHASDEIRAICHTSGWETWKITSSLLIVFAYFIIRLVVRFVNEKIARLKDQ